MLSMGLELGFSEIGGPPGALARPLMSVGGKVNLPPLQGFVPPVFKIMKSIRSLALWVNRGNTGEGKTNCVEAFGLQSSRHLMARATSRPYEGRVKARPVAMTSTIKEPITARSPALFSKKTSAMPTAPSRISKEKRSSNSEQ